MFEIGVAKKVIDICPLGVGMMGYGIAKQKVEGTLHPLHVRSFMIRSLRTQQVVAYASVELAFLSLAVVSTECSGAPRPRKRSATSPPEPAVSGESVSDPHATSALLALTS